MTPEVPTAPCSDDRSRAVSAAELLINVKVAGPPIRQPLTTVAFASSPSTVVFVVILVSCAATLAAKPSATRHVGTTCRMSHSSLLGRPRQPGSGSGIAGSLPARAAHSYVVSGFSRTTHVIESFDNECGPTWLRAAKAS